jgi:antitoxin (DNA-binding transcriptional repressor) of toxin-antitoxin stability system
MTMSFVTFRGLGKGAFDMEHLISKSKFKPRALYYFREVEQTGKELIISDLGKTVLKIVPYTEDPAESLKALRNSVLKYEDPTAPVGLDDWESLR